MLQIVRVVDQLPADIDRLVIAGTQEQVRNMSLLVRNWSDGTDRFARNGEVLLAGMMAGELVGIGGLSLEPAADQPARRLRRFYVLPQSRRSGVATALACALIQEASEQVRLLTVNARASAIAPIFWETQGFEPDQSGPWTHWLRLP